MSLVDKVVSFITDELKIDINEENKKLIVEKFYPDIKDKLYWSCICDCRLYEGIVSKEDYEKIKTLPPTTNICFAEIAKYVDDECELKYISFTDDINKIKQYYDIEGRNSRDNFCLMSYFYDQGKLYYEEEED